MKAISLWQPWASLVAYNYKKIETRSWPAPKNLIGQRIAIHATKSMPGWVKKILRGFASLLGIEKYEGSWLYYLEHGVGDFGKVVATARLADCCEIFYDPRRECVRLDNGKEIYGNELEFGDYTPGRWAWILEDVQPLSTPVPAKGMQGLWEWKEGDALG